MADDDGDIRKEPEVPRAKSSNDMNGDHAAFETDSGSYRSQGRMPLSTLSPTSTAADSSSFGWRGGNDTDRKGALQYRSSVFVDPSAMNAPLLGAENTAESLLFSRGRGLGTDSTAGPRTAAPRSPAIVNRNDKGPVGGSRNTGSVATVRELPLRLRRLLWTFWRRRTIRKIGSIISTFLSSLCSTLRTTASTISSDSCGSSSSSSLMYSSNLHNRLLNQRWARRLVAAISVLLTSAVWFVAITGLVGPPAPLGSQADDNEGIPSYYQRIPGVVGIGPSLDDTWVVREIQVAAAGWQLQAGHIRGGDMGLVGGSVLAETGWSTLGGAHGEVNNIMTGPLVANNGTLPKADLLLTIFSGNTGPDAAKRELLRQIYDKYEGWVTVGGANSITGSKNPERREFTLKVVFVMSREGSPPEGELIGDILYVPVPEGYRNIVLKTRAMLCLVRHVEFKYLLKADDDSFVCLARIASMLHDLPPEISDKVYAGVPTACNQETNPDYWNGRVMKNPYHRWYDSKYVKHTLGSLNCFPPYMQGAFYVLAQPLVEHLYRGHQHLECFTNEDVTVGSWLMGVDREIVELYNLRTSHLWDCLCARTHITAKTRKKQMFFHNCKGMSQLKLCGTRLLRPGIGC